FQPPSQTTRSYLDTVTGADMVALPFPSYALHWIVCEPAVTFFTFHLVVNGATLLCVCKTPSAYNSTFLTARSSVALTRTETVPATLTFCLGDSIVICGGARPGLLSTVTEIETVAAFPL